MEQVTTLWNGLGLRRQVIVVVATLATLGAVLGLARMATAPGMALLYAGLEGGPAGEVIAALDQRGIRYSVAGDAIYVESALRDQTRMMLAAEGMPANTGAGYELLDRLSGFGTTAQMFDAAYWRAREGELARTILSSPQVVAARVHISQGASQPFRRAEAPTASVSVTTRGGSIPPGQAQALRFLVASAVPGMRPEAVAIIDGTGALVPGPGDAGGAADTADRATALRNSVERLLAAHVGPGRAVVEIAVETVTEAEVIRETRFDPEGRVAISTDTEERTRQATGPDGPGVTVASNLPGGDAGAEAGRSESRDSESRSRVNYEVTEIQRQVERAPGSVRRITVAVIVDGHRETGADGAEQWSPRSDAELAALRDLVAAAVGFDADRGDVITLHSLPLDLAVPGQGDAPPGFLAPLRLDPMTLIQLAVLALVALVLGLFVLRPLLRQRAAAPEPVRLPQPGAVRLAQALPSASAEAEGEPLTGDIEPPARNAPALVRGATDAAAPVGAAGADRHDEAVARLRRLIADRQDETVEILRSWMEDREEQT